MIIVVRDMAAECRRYGLKEGLFIMPHIRPISDLRNHFAAIATEVRQSSEPVFLTRNGYGVMVVMSMEAFEDKNFESEIYYKLKEAELEAKTTGKRLSHVEVLAGLRARTAAKKVASNV